MTRPLSIVTTCKPFEGHAAVIQRNALESWAKLEPACEVLVVGDEPGVKDVCVELGFRHLPEVERTAVGTPLVSSLLARADDVARFETVALVNSDILLTGSVLRAVARAQDELGRALVLARRWNTPLRELWAFREGCWEGDLAELAADLGRLEPVWGGIDFFAYPKGLFADFPPFAIGRGRWDSYLILDARRRGVPVVDATEACLTLHQDHSYEHVQLERGRASPSKPDYVRSREGRENERLLGSAGAIATCLNATHRLDRDGLHPNPFWVRNPLHLLRKLAALPGIHPQLRPLGVLARLGAPLWRGLQRARRSRQGL